MKDLNKWLISLFTILLVGGVGSVIKVTAEVSTLVETSKLTQGHIKEMVQELSASNKAHDSAIHDHEVRIKVLEGHSEDGRALLDIVSKILKRMESD